MLSHDETEPRQLTRSLACPHCSHTMTLTGIEPHDRYINLKVEAYTCDACGEQTTVAVRFV